MVVLRHSVHKNGTDNLKTYTSDHGCHWCAWRQKRKWEKHMPTQKYSCTTCYKLDQNVAGCSLTANELVKFYHSGLSLIQNLTHNGSWTRIDRHRQYSSSANVMVLATGFRHQPLLTAINIFKNVNDLLVFLSQSHEVPQIPLL